MGGQGGSRLSEQECCSPHEHGRGGHPSDAIATRRKLLHTDQDGEEAHPHQVHDAHCEAGQHQRPATADAVGAVDDSKTKAAVRSVLPVREEIGERISAVSQTGAAERREKDKARCNQYTTCDGRRQFPAVIEEGGAL